MDLKELLAAAGLVVAFLGMLTKVKAVETWLDAKMKQWLESRPKRQLARRLTPQQFASLANGHEDAETVCLILQGEYEADRVTLTEYEEDPDNPGQMLATVRVEVRTASIPSVKQKVQRMVVPAETWAEVQRIHGTECRCRFLADVRLLDVAPMRQTLIHFGVASAYYQTMPTSGGRCAGLLSMSWHQQRTASVEQLAAWYLSGRMLAAVLRIIWSFPSRDDSSPSS